jgi:UDP-GlcNAc:undecaprenyl-phosphate GlcNAc-1-phosphate transferase
MSSSYIFLQVGLSFAGKYDLPLQSFITAFIIALLLIPLLITVVTRYQLLDKPNSRKEHHTPVPTMGGIAIAIGFFCSYLLWIPTVWDAISISFTLGIIVLLIAGMMDDIKDIPARYKFIIQIAVAALLAVSGLRVQDFGGIMGIHQLPLAAQYTCTIFIIVGITNAYNLIDGINGLAGSLAFMGLVTLGIFLQLAGDTTGSLLAFALAGAVLGFLYFNLDPAKIFMGDTGSLLLGFIIAVLTIRLMNGQIILSNGSTVQVQVIALGIVLIPVFDTARVFLQRIWRGGSPFVADRTHFHHFFTNKGIGHAITCGSMIVINGIILLIALQVQYKNPNVAVLLLLFFMICITYLCSSITYFSFGKQKSLSKN